MTAAIHPGWSTDPGFPNLSPSRRRSLCAMIDRADDHHHRSAMLVAAMVDADGFSAETIGAASRIRDRYTALIVSIELQFPERRADRRGTFSADDARGNESLLKTLLRIDTALADASGTDRSELRAWLDGNREMMPRPLPLMAKVQVTA